MEDNAFIKSLKEQYNKTLSKPNLKTLIRVYNDRVSTTNEPRYSIQKSIHDTVAPFFTRIQANPPPPQPRPHKSKSKSKTKTKIIVGGRRNRKRATARRRHR
jgi:hypothetical protein